VERDYRLYLRIIGGMISLGLLFVAGCIGPYLIWSPQLQDAQFQRQKARAGGRAWTYQGQLQLEEMQQQWDAVDNELKMLADK
jgi:hypothetical protein